jgi:hypothetical protein
METLAKKYDEPHRIVIPNPVNKRALFSAPE